MRSRLSEPGAFVAEMVILFLIESSHILSAQTLRTHRHERGCTQSQPIPGSIAAKLTMVG
jgi:hypothetical protein